MARHGCVFLSHLLGKPAVVVGYLANWQRTLSADFELVDQMYPESFVKATGTNLYLDRTEHDFAVRVESLANLERWKGTMQKRPT